MSCTLSFMLKRVYKFYLSEALRDMRVLKEQILQLIFTRVRELNSENTEEDLNMLISEKILEDRLGNCIGDIDENIKVVKGEPDENKHEPNGAWVYRDGVEHPWVFEKFSTIAEAIRRAVEVINSVVICNGTVVHFDLAGDGQAYYIENNTGKIKLVNIT